MYPTDVKQYKYRIDYYTGERVFCDTVYEVFRQLGGQNKYVVSNNFTHVCVNCKQTLSNSDFGRVCKVISRISTRAALNNIPLASQTFNDTIPVAVREVYAKTHTYKTSVIVRDSEHNILTLRDLSYTFEEEQRHNRYSKWSSNSRYQEHYDKRSIRRERNLTSRIGVDFCYYRSPATHNELKQLEYNNSEIIKPRIRGKRSRANLVSAWDDIRVSLYDSLDNWKTMKIKKQWMINDKDTTTHKARKLTRYQQAEMFGNELDN